TLALYRGQIPPALHFEVPNRQIRFERTPFYLNERLRPWPRGSQPRLAGVSSFGLGGTNAHAVLEEPPVNTAAGYSPAPSAPRAHALVLSARSWPALNRLAERYAAHLVAHPEQDFADVCFTANAGHARFAHRLAVVAQDGQAAAALLSRFATSAEPRSDEAA